MGTLAGLVVPIGLGVWEAALLAAILAPTDAALGQSVVASPAVPGRVRQALNIESGLNDGIALPVVLLFASLAAASHATGGDRNWVLFGLMQITLGPLAGIAVGWCAARLIDRAAEAEWMAETEGSRIRAAGFEHGDAEVGSSAGRQHHTVAPMHREHRRYGTSGRSAQ